MGVVDELLARTSHKESTNMGVVDNEQVRKAVSDSVLKALDRMGVLRKGEHDWYALRRTFGTNGHDILNQGMLCAAMAQDVKDRSYDEIANKAMRRAVEPAMRGLMHCAEIVGGYEYTIPLPLVKSVPSPSRMKGVYFKYTKLNFVECLSWTYQRLVREGKYDEIDWDEAKRDVQGSWRYRQARARGAKAKPKYDYVIHSDLDYEEFDEWRRLGRNLNKPFGKMRGTKWGVHVQNKEVLAQMLMGFAAKVYIFWRELEDGVYLKGENDER